MWTGEDGEHKNEEEAIQKAYDSTVNVKKVLTNSIAAAITYNPIKNCS